MAGRLTAAEEAELATLRADAARDRAAMTEAQIARMETLQDLERGIADSTERRLAALKRQAELLVEQEKRLKAIAETGKTVVGLYKTQLDIQQNILKTRLEQVDSTKDGYEAEILEIQRLQEKLDIKKKGYADSENFAKRFMGITREPTSEFGKFLVDPSARLEGLTQGLGEVVDGMSIMTSTVDKVVESTIALAMEQDAAVVNFRRATGASGEFDDNIRGLERSLFTAGVSAAEAGQAVQSLYLNVTDFSEMSETSQEVLGKTVAVLNELGVAAENSSKNIQFAIKVLGKTEKQAADLQRELITFAQDLGVSVDQMASDFASMGPQIAALGSKGVDAFRSLEVQAKNTGLQLSEILGLVEKFDTFDGAAQAVGKLNALLGGPYLNTLELVAETDPSKRFEILKDRVDAAGLSFNSMDYYQRKALASAMGLNETQLAMLMQGNLSQIMPPPKSAEELIELQKQTAQFNTVMEELGQAARALAVSFGPLVSTLKAILQFMSPVLEAMAKAPGSIFAIIAGVSALTRGFSLMKLQIKEMTKAERNSLILFAAFGAISLIAQLYEMGVAWQYLAAGVGVATIAIIAMATAEKMSVILGAIGLVTSGVSMLAHSIAVGNSPSLIQAFMMLAAAIPFVTLAMLALMPLLPALLLMVPPLVFAFVMLADALSEMFSEQFINNLQLMAIEIANIVSSINELSATKAVAFTATMAATTVASTAAALTGGAVASVAAATAAPAATPAASPAAMGPAPVINVNLSIDGTEFATVVNSVEVEPYSGGKPSDLHGSILHMIEQGLMSGRRGI